MQVPWDATGNKLSGFQRFGCVWLRLTRKFIEEGDVLRSGQGEQPVVLTAWHLVSSWDGVPAAAQAVSSKSLGTKKDLGKSGASWFIYIFLISWSLDFSGGFSVKGHRQTGSFLVRWGISSLGWVGGWNLKALLTFGAVIWCRGFRWAGGKSRAAPSHSSRGIRRDSHLEQEPVPLLRTHLQYIYTFLCKYIQQPLTRNHQNPTI